MSLLLKESGKRPQGRKPVLTCHFALSVRTVVVRSFSFGLSVGTVVGRSFFSAFQSGGKLGLVFLLAYQACSHFFGQKWRQHRSFHYKIDPSILSNPVPSIFLIWKIWDSIFTFSFLNQKPLKLFYNWLKVEQFDNIK